MKRLLALLISIVACVLSLMAMGTLVVLAGTPDTTAPVTTINLSPTLPNGAGGWYKTNVLVKVAATDNTGGSGLSATRCVLDPSSVPVSYNDLPAAACAYTGAGAYVSVDGNHVVYAASIDKASNAGTPVKTVGFKLDKTPPTAALSVTAGTPGNNGWYTSNVTVHASGEDAASGVTCTPDRVQSVETKGTSYSGSCTNGAGLTTNATSLTIKLDRTPPTATLSVTAGTAGSNGWYKSDVTVRTTGSDTISSPVNCTGDQFQTTETAGTVIAGSCTNAAGLTTSANSLTIKLDKTPPTAVVAVTAGTPGNNGWYTSNVTVHTSGEDSMSVPVICSADQYQNAETPGRIFNGSCTNNAGLKTTAAPLTVKLDKTPPTVSVSASPDSLWPPNHQLSDVSTAVDVNDSISGSAGFVLTSVTSSEPDEGLGDGDIAADVQGFVAGTADTNGQLRAERAGGGGGRTYTLSYTGTDMAGNAASASAVVTIAHSAAAPRKSAIAQGADRVVALQRTDPAWQGTWYWYVGNTANVTNLTGTTALGLVEAYRDTKDAAYLDAAKAAAGFVMTHLGSGATGSKYFARMTSSDIILLHRLTQLTGDPAYAQRGTSEWANIKAFWPTAGVLDMLFRTLGRRLGAWDLAAYLEAARLSGDTAWADDAASILANTGDTFYYGTDNVWYPLAVSGTLEGLAANGYAETYPTATATLLNMVMGTVAVDNVAGGVQATAYGVIALKAVGGPATGTANAMAKWLAANQGANGGWMDDGDEYPEADGEAVDAIATTIGSNVNLSGSVSGGAGDAGWRAGANPGKARRFDLP